MQKKKKVLRKVKKEIS